ncbi:hypothetical protein F4818DRAFT_454174 [Hypoxylon cercidicola]|nr:hypothetical protein F4818DRAFT_454174 [Hypoxylon cercidicola]
MSPSFSDGLPVNYPPSYNGVKDTRPNCSTQSTGGSTEVPSLESYYMPSPTTQGAHLGRQSQSQQNNSPSNLLAAAINPSIATYPNPHQHLHSASSSQGMLATPPSTTYEGEELDHYSYHGSPTSGVQPLAPSSAHPSAPSPRGWSPLEAQQMGLQQPFLRSPESMLTYNFRNYAPIHHEQQVHSQVVSSPYQNQTFAPANPDVDAMAHQDVLPVLAGLHGSDQAMSSQAQSPPVKEETRDPSHSEGGNSRRPSRVVNGEEGGKVDEPYAQLIHRAFMSRDRRAMTLQEIYQWFRENTEKGKSDNKGWQNSIRHNLSMNRAFSKRELKPINGEPLGGLRGSKKLSEWYLMPWAVNGVQSTTRYRTKGTSRRRNGAGSAQPCANSSRRALSGRKGGLTASKSKAKKASQDRDQHHASAFPGGANGGDMHMGNMVLDPNMGFPYGIPDPMTPPDHGPPEMILPHHPMQAAALPVTGSHGYAYPAPELSQYGQSSGSYHVPHSMYSLDEVSGMYQGQPVSVPSHAGQGPGQPHSMGGMNPIYEESEDMRQRRLAFQYQGWSDSVPGSSYQQ